MSEEIYINTGGSFQQPYNARTPANSQTPAQGRSPFTYIAQGRTPFTYQSRSPITYIAQGQAQNPVIANAQQTYPYQANAQTPYIANAQQPYPYIAAAQQPVIANAQQPYPYQANAQTPYIANARSPFTYQARTPFTYQARYPANAQQPYIANARQPFTYQARTPFTYARQGTTPAIGTTPYTFNATRPATGTQSVPVIEIDVATDFNTLAASPYTTNYYSGYSAIHPSPQSWLSYDRIDISNSQAGNTSTNIFPGPTVSQCALISGNYYGVSTNNYFAYCFIIQSSTASVGTLQLAIANYANGTSSAGSAYSSSSGSSILGVKIWGPTSWPRGSTPDFSYATSSAASVNYSSTVARWTGSTYVSDPAIVWSWNVGAISASFLGNQSNASNNNANGIFRFQIYDV